MTDLTGADSFTKDKICSPFSIPLACVCYADTASNGTVVCPDEDDCKEKTGFKATDLVTAATGWFGNLTATCMYVSTFGVIDALQMYGNII